MNVRVQPTDIDDSPQSKRQQEIFAAVLDLMVELGDGFSMAAVAKRASCSKETLYRWFTDRDGLLTATVQWQASKVVMPEIDQSNLSEASFRQTLEQFAKSWLTVLTGDVSIALNRLAVSHGGNANSNLGDIVLKNGPFAMKQRLAPLFELAREKGIIDINGDDAFRLFFGLVVAETQIRALLGDQPFSRDDDLLQVADTATEQFLVLAKKNFKNDTIKE